MKMKKIKNYILTFVICLLSAFIFNIENINALELTSNNDYISSNLVDVESLVYGGIDGTNGAFTSSSIRTRSNLISYDASINGTRLYLKVFDTGFCNNFIGVRMGLQTYTSNSTSSHIDDSGWIPLTGSGAYNYYDVPSNTKYVAFVFSFSSTSTSVSTGGTEVSSLNLNSLSCFKMYVGKDNVTKYQRYNELLYIGSNIISCEVYNSTISINCDGWLSYQYDRIDLTYLSNVLERSGFYDDYEEKYYYKLVYNEPQSIWTGLRFVSSGTEGVYVDFYRGLARLGSLDMSRYDELLPFAVANLTNTDYDSIVVTNVNLDYKLESIITYDYEWLQASNNYVYGIGYDNGRISGYNAGYDDGYDEGAESQNTLIGMVGAIFTGPVTMFQQIFNFNVLGVNLAEMLLGLVTLLVVIWLIKKFI